MPKSKITRDPIPEEFKNIEEAAESIAWPIMKIYKKMSILKLI